MYSYALSSTGTTLLAVVAVLAVTIQAQELQPVDNTVDDCKDAQELLLIVWCNSSGW